jgi:broad specificity phosphatase PhoE
MMRRRPLLFGWAALPVRAQGAPSRVLAIRHALTEPGVGDPPGYVLGRCETQRQLSTEGRAQARAFGERLASIGWRPDAVWSSRWCRCLDTAALIAAGVGAPPVQP